MSKMVGEWIIDPKVITPNFDPSIIKGFNETMGRLQGSSFEALVYCGKQLVNGTNHMFVAKQTITAPDAPTHVAKIVLNETFLNGNSTGEFTIISIETIA